jgi:hypothetical protein
MPIFDTNIFGHVQDGSISRKDWRFLLQHRPGHGWPLSTVTALELLTGVHAVPSERFLQHREQIELACNLSKGRIHEEPHYLLCKEVLRVPFPAEIPRLPTKLIADYMTVARRANSREEILAGKVLVKGLLTKGGGYRGYSGFLPSVLKELVAGPKSAWQTEVERLASEIYPRWREHFQETGKRLPVEMRKGLESRSAWDAERLKWSESVLRWLRATVDPESVAEITKKLDAVLEFTIYVTREFLTRNYKLENHESDVYDQFQLHHLAMDRFLIVTEDKDFRTRAARSSQAERIMSFDQFLRNL